MQRKWRLEWCRLLPAKGASLALCVLFAACGTPPVTQEDSDVFVFVLPDAKADVASHPDAQPDVVGTDAVVDVADVPPDVPPDTVDVEDVAPDMADLFDSGPPDVYVPECVTDTTCDDQNLCTVDLCVNDNCKHTPTPGCCLQDADCPKAPVCKSATCVNNACLNQPVAKCCASGVCCDPATQTAKLAQTPCTDAPIAFEFNCQGVDIWGRRAIPGCDGTQNAACSGSAADYNWTDWLPVASCPSGSLCVKNNDKSQMPTCSGTPAPEPSCTTDIGCYDGAPCTTDTCLKGNCTHTLADPATLCGTAPIFAQYGCLNGPGGGDPGGAIITHSQFATCGAAGKCDGKPDWAPWTIVQDCLMTEKCDVPITSEPGTCALIPVCNPGSSCCGPDGLYLPTGTACGSAVVATEYQCESADKGGKYSEREGVAGCSGTSSLCSAITPSWAAWKPAGSCAYNQTCSLPIASAPPLCTDVCTAGSTCCTDIGDWADQGTKCASALLKSVMICTAANGVESVLSSQLFPGCSGVDGTCSTDTANLYKSAYSIVKQCASYEKCMQTGDFADCILNAPCQPGTQCCAANGQFAPAGTPCKPTGATQYSCSNNLPGGAILTRNVFFGCSGAGTECSYSPSSYSFSPWLDTTDCLPTEVCLSADPTFLTSADCTSAFECVPNTVCCDGLGKFVIKGTKCGPPDVKKTYYKCDSVDLNASILKQEYYASCVGTAANCSTLDADLVWDPPVWLNKQACGPMNYCHVSGPTDPGLCNSSPP